MSTFSASRATAAVLAVAATALTVAAPARAADADTRSTVVRYADLDVTSAAGAARLDRRIRQAARVVCGPVNRHDLGETKMVDECRSVAVAHARTQIDVQLAGAAPAGVVVLAAR